MGYPFGNNAQNQNYGFNQNSQAGISPFIIVSNVDDEEKAVAQTNETNHGVLQADTICPCCLTASQSWR